MILKKIFCMFCLITLSAFIAALFIFKQSGFAVLPRKNLVPSDYHTGITWQDAQKSEKPVIVNFYVDWCNACRRFAPVFENLRKQYSLEYNFVIVKADSPVNEKIISEFYIPGYPTVYLINSKENKKMRADFTKYHDIEEFKKEINDFFKEPE